MIAQSGSIPIAVVVTVVKVLLVSLCVCLDVTGVEEIRGLDGRKAPVVVAAVKVLLAVVCVCLEVAGVRSMREIGLDAAGVLP